MGRTVVHFRRSIFERASGEADHMPMGVRRFRSPRTSALVVCLTAITCGMAIALIGPAAAHPLTQNERLQRLVRYPTAAERAGLLRFVKGYYDRPPESYTGTRVVGFCVSRAHPRLAELNEVIRGGAGGLTPMYRIGKLTWVIRAAPRSLANAGARLSEATSLSPCGHTTAHTFHPVAR